MMFFSSPVFFVVLAALFVENEGAVAVQSANGNSLPNYARTPQDSSNCCILPTCDHSGHCYQTLSCGYVCSHGNYRPATRYGSTPGYRLKEYYAKEDCHFGECKAYRFLCTHCPNPKEDDFSIYTVRKDCKNCYY